MLWRAKVVLRLRAWRVRVLHTPILIAEMQPYLHLRLIQCFSAGNGIRVAVRVGAVAAKVRSRSTVEGPSLTGVAYAEIVELRAYSLAVFLQAAALLDECGDFFTERLWHLDISCQKFGLARRVLAGEY